MKSARLLIFTFAAALLSSALSSHGQTLAADYQLQDTYNSSVGSIGPLKPLPTGTSDVYFGDGTVNGVMQRVLVIQTAQSNPFPTSGVQTQTNGFISSTNYSIVLQAQFSLSTNLTATKIFDFKNLSSDAGLYVNNATGVLEFVDDMGIIQNFGGLSLTSSDYVEIALTRDASTNLTSVFLNNQLAFSFTDSNGLAILGDATMSGNSYLTLFKDDGGNVGGSAVNETSQGSIARLRLYDGVIAVPEPGTWALLGFGLAIATGPAIRRRRRA